MKFRKFLNVTYISSILGIFSFIILTATLSKENLNEVTGFILFPFTDKLQPGLQSSRFIHWLVISLAMFFYIIMIKGIIRLFQKPVQPQSSYPEMVCQSEIASMLDAVDSEDDAKINEKIITFMKKFDEMVAEIFEMDNNDLKSLWVLQMDKDEYQKSIEKENEEFYQNDHKSFLMIVNLNEHLKPTEEDKRIIRWALQQPNPQFWDDRVKRNFNGENREFVFVRNYGEFRLGYALLFKHQHMITEEKLQHFQAASSYLMLLGKINDLTHKMIKYILEKVV
ncbi:hypothetical protein GWK91_15535 [Virgibacillus sp. MSP4-1]|uniref:hypothetical protein n=1 Tax=Virgibacillus sp. MSP4-1 TaxID=2700081 RepID=UPI00039E9D1C|nr:hypothetical protein [Virgibacillus sp. MSP4-1]QHS24221.1 hypothetical protein GWK91_15535 [Virgibacillus sp. MSP4-1]